MTNALQQFLQTNGGGAHSAPQTPGYDPAEARSRYQQEVAAGDRLPNGAKPLKRLKARHREMVEMHLSGYRNRDIARYFGVTDITVNRILSDPLAQALIVRAGEEAEQRLQALANSAVDSVQAAMHEERDVETRLKGVDRWVKLRDAMGSRESERLTAEDVIQRVLAGAFSQTNIQVNVGASHPGEGATLAQPQSERASGTGPALSPESARPEEVGGPSKVPEDNT